MRTPPILTAIVLFVTSTGALADAAPAGSAPAPTPAPASDPAPTSTGAIRIAVADLQNKGIDPKLNAIFLDSLLVELRKLQRVSVIGMDEVRAMLDLEAQKQVLGCGEEKSCLAEIAGAVGADVLVVGGIVDLGAERVLGLKRIEQKTAAVSQQMSQRLTNANGEEVLAAVGPAVEKLFPDHPLRAGEVRGVSKEMALRLNPPPVPVWAFGTTAAAAGIGVVVTGVAGAAWLGYQQGYKDLGQQARTQVTAGTVFTKREGEVRGAELAMWIAGTTTLALGVAAGAMVPFVDWDGYGAAPPTAPH